MRVAKQAIESLQLAAAQGDMLCLVPGATEIDRQVRPLMDAGCRSSRDVAERLADVVFFVMPHPFEPTSLDLFGSMTQLKVVQVLSSGVDHVRSLVPGGAVLCNAPNLHATPTAEVAMSLILASLNHVPAWVLQQSRSSWADPGPRPGLAGKKVAILGYGAVGQALGRMLAGFAVQVFPIASEARPLSGVAGLEDLIAIISGVDILVVAVPLTDRTRDLVGAALLSHLPDGALVVNVSRGQVVDTKALLCEARSGRLTAAMDVVEPEPLPEDHPLWSCPGILISPHVGGNMADFWDRASLFLNDQLRRFEQGQPLLSQVPT